MESDRQARIEQRAYEIWESEGCPDGKHDEHWQRAEQEIAAEDSPEDSQGDSVPAAGGRTGRAAQAKSPAPSEAGSAPVSKARAKDEAAPGSRRGAGRSSAGAASSGAATRGRRPAGS